MDSLTETNTFDIKKNDQVKWKTEKKKFKLSSSSVHLELKLVH